MRVNKVVLQQLASAEAVLTKDERELGAAVIDIGGGTTDIAVFMKSAVQFTKVLPVGGIHFTRDLAIALQTPMDDAERIKKDWGTVLTERASDDEFVEAPGIGTRSARSFSKRYICKILRDRAIELLELTRDQLFKTVGNEQLIAGVVLTGGCGMLDGMQELAEEILGMPVRLGLPLGIKGLKSDFSHPGYATAIGLILFSAAGSRERKKNQGKPAGSTWFVSRILQWAGN